jgi:hypothetical protein
MKIRVTKFTKSNGDAETKLKAVEEYLESLSDNVIDILSGNIDIDDNINWIKKEIPIQDSGEFLIDTSSRKYNGVLFIKSSNQETTVQYLGLKTTNNGTSVVIALTSPEPTTVTLYLIP